MTTTRQIIEAMDRMGESVVSMGKALADRILSESKRIDVLEEQLAALTKEPHKPFKQKLRERQQ